MAQMMHSLLGYSYLVCTNYTAIVITSMVSVAHSPDELKNLKTNYYICSASHSLTLLNFVVELRLNKFDENKPKEKKNTYVAYAYK